MFEFIVQTRDRFFNLSNRCNLMNILSLYTKDHPKTTSQQHQTVLGDRMLLF